MKILITGHKGFIGQNLTLYLQNDHELFGYEWQEDSLPEVEGFDWVIHVGAISSTTETNAEKLMKMNYEFTTDLIVKCLEMNIDIQYASSASVYGNSKTFKEGDDCHPMNGYAWSKYLVDRFVEETLAMGSLPINIQGFRYFNVYGKFEGNKGNQASPITKFKLQAVTDESIMLFENSDEYKRDFVCVDDICEVHEKMIDTEASGIFNVGTGNAVSFASIGEAIATKYGVTINHIAMPDQLRGSYQTFTEANIDQLSKHIDMKWTNVLDYINDV